MHLITHLKKEIRLALRGMYFYIEIVMAVIILIIVRFIIPENFSNMSQEYIYLDLPPEAAARIEEDLLSDDLDGQIKRVTLDKIYPARLFESEDSQRYLLDSKEAVIALAESEKNIGAVISLDDNQSLYYDYYLQGYESAKVKNLLLAIHQKDLRTLEDSFNRLPVSSLSDDAIILNDRAFTLPAFLTFNGALMGMFIIAAYIFLDKDEGVIKAILVSPSSIFEYLLSKVILLTGVSLITSLLITIPVMGSQANYLLLLIFLICTGFFASALGLLIGSFYDDIMHAFGMIFLLIIVMLLPTIANFIPSWDPLWLRILPSYGMIQGFTAIIKGGFEASTYILGLSALYLALGLVLFAYSNHRFKRSIAV